MKTAAWIVAAFGVGAVSWACVVENVTPTPGPARPRPTATATASVSAAPVAPPPPVPTPSSAPTPAPMPAPAPSTAPAASATTETTAATGGDFFACQADPDCIAVRKVGCCNHGDKEAVNANAAGAYAASFTCPDPRPICPQFMRRDLRVAACNQGTHRCEMVSGPAPAP